MEIRSKGFYWVKMFDKWEVAGWSGDAWYFTGTSQSAKDNELINIGGRILLSDAEIAHLDLSDKSKLVCPICGKPSHSGYKLCFEHLVCNERERKLSSGKIR